MGYHACIGLGCGDTKGGLAHHTPESLGRVGGGGENLATTTAKHRLGGNKERHVATQLGGQRLQRGGGKTERINLVEGHKSGGRIGTTATQASTKGYLLVKSDVGTTNAIAFPHQHPRLDHKVAVGGAVEGEPIGLKVNGAIHGGYHLKGVAHATKLQHQGVYFVVTIGAAAQDVESEVYLGVGGEYHFSEHLFYDHKDNYFTFATKPITMKFRTEIALTPSEWRLSHSNHIVAVGSCFADNVAARMDLWGLPVVANPLGEMFNPKSVVATIERLTEGTPFVAEELHQRGDVWFSYATHGAFDGTDKEQVLAALNEAVVAGHKALAEADTVVLTLGTAWVYERSGRVVANCHKMPAEEFVRRRLSVEEVVESVVGLVEGPLKGKRTILTVSPVRHLADGLEGNAVSKAVLRLAAEQVAERCAGVVEYFPAYEIVLDDLRDYRFVGPDLVHPSQEAVDYVWERFVERYVEPHTAELGRRVEALRRAAAHRPLHPDSSEWAHFKATMLRKAKALQAELPEGTLEQELDFFGR